jgi:hypothetical protein
MFLSYLSLYLNIAVFVSPACKDPSSQDRTWAEWLLLCRVTRWACLWDNYCYCCTLVFVVYLFLNSQECLSSTENVVPSSIVNSLRTNRKFWEELIAYFPLIRHGPHRKQFLQLFFVAAGTCLLSYCLATIWGTQPDRLLWYDIENNASNNYSLFLVFVAAGMCLLSHCLATVEGIHIQTDWWERFMKYVVEMGSVAMIYIPSFIKIGSCIQSW